LIEGPGEKAYENILAWEDVVRHRLLSHIHRCSVPCAIAEIPGAIESRQVFAHSEEKAVFRKIAMVHMASRFF
jgi:hypothetical protein